jgi:hypothetical protein
MQRNGILSVGLLLLSCLTVRAQDQPVLDLKAENELLRRERDAFESRLRIMQEQLDEARRAASAARLEIDGLETQCRKLQDELKRSKGQQPTRIVPDVAAPTDGPKSQAVRGKVTALSANLRTMQISMGQDAALKVGQVLDVFRLASDEGSPPLYLGVIRLTRVDPHAAVGQYERAPLLDRAPRIGDDVSNELNVK